MRFRHFLAVCLAITAAAAAAPAAAQAQVEGTYAAEEREMASALRLQAGGRFEFYLSVGALDMAAAGRWRQEGSDIILDTEPAVVPPRFELLGSGRENTPSFVVRVQDPRGELPVYLDAEIRFETGEPAYAYLDGDLYRLDPTPDRRIVSVRVGSSAFGFWSDPFPVPQGHNALRFRFFPGDLGRADFRGTRARLEGNAVTLSLLGAPIRYRRLTEQEMGSDAER